MKRLAVAELRRGQQLLVIPAGAGQVVLGHLFHGAGEGGLLQHATDEVDLVQFLHRQQADVVAAVRPMIDETLAEGFLDGLAKVRSEMAANPEHPLRLKAEEGLESFARDLRSDPAMRARVARLRDEFIANPAVADWLETIWQTIRTGMLSAVRSPGAMGQGRLGEMLRQLGQTLLDDARLRETINRFTRRAVVGTVARYGDGIVALVSETIRRWDAKTVTDRLEGAVGRDLQYIRINGTLVGGLVGLALHLLGTLL